MARVLYQGIRREDISLLVGGPFDIVASDGGHYDTGWSDAALRFNLGDLGRVTLVDATMTPDSIGVGHNCFIHALVFSPAGDGLSGHGILLRDSAEYPWLLFTKTDDQRIGVFVNTGTEFIPIWTQIGGVVQVSGALHDYDIQVHLDAAGNHQVRFFLDRNLVAGMGGNFSNPAFTNIAFIDLGAVDQNRYTDYSQFLVTEDMPTIGAHVKTSRATGAGHYGDWAGAYTDVNEPGDNDTTINQTGVVGAIQSYPMGDITTPEGYVIHGVFMFLRARNNGVAPQNIKALLRTGGVDYLSAVDLPGMDIGFTSVGWRWDQDPATTDAWTDSGYNAIELGFESET